MSFNTKKNSNNNLQSSSQSLKSSQPKPYQQGGSINPFKQAVKRNPYLKPQPPTQNQVTGNDNEDYEGEGDIQKNAKMREIISIDRFNGKIVKKWVPIEEESKEFRRSTLTDMERTRQSVFSRPKPVNEKPALGGGNLRDSLYGTQSQSPKQTQEQPQTKRVEPYSQYPNKTTANINFNSPDKLLQNVEDLTVNEFHSPTNKYNSPSKFGSASNNKYNSTKIQNFETPTKRYKPPQNPQQIKKTSGGFDTQSPLEFPKPDPYQSPIKDYLIEWINTENLTQPSIDYLKNQTNLTNWQRSELINWIPKLYEKINYKGQNYFLIVRLIDRSLGAKNFPKSELKSLILSSIWFISHYYDSSPLNLHQFLNILDLPIEYFEKIKNLNNWLYQNFFSTMLNCNPILFLRKISLELGLHDNYLLNICKYLMDYSLLDYKLSQLRPSLIASATLLITKYLLSKLSQTEAEAIARLTGYKLRQLIQVGCFIIDYTMTHPNYLYINEKYDNIDNYQNFSKFIRVELFNCRPLLAHLISNNYNLVDNNYNQRE